MYRGDSRVKGTVGLLKTHFQGYRTVPVVEWDNEWRRTRLGVPLSWLNTKVYMGVYRIYCWWPQIYHTSVSHFGVTSGMRMSGGGVFYTYVYRWSPLVKDLIANETASGDWESAGVSKFTGLIRPLLYSHDTYDGTLITSTMNIIIILLLLQLLPVLLVLLPLLPF